ncbi:MAG: aldo/keto reductase [Myxococcota bacterium]
MRIPNTGDGTSRRRFLQGLAMLGVGAKTLLRSRDAGAAVYAAKSAGGVGTLPPMAYRNLGRTGFQASRLVFGCGAALSRGRKDELLAAALDAGVNVFDVGFRGYYRDAEENLAPFLKKARDRVFLISKAIPTREIAPDETVTPAKAKAAADAWLGYMDESLRELGVDSVDAYYVMGANNPSFIQSDEIQTAFERAKAAGKVRHLGLSTHQNAEQVLEAAIASGAYSLAMIAITPAGWYDWEDRGILPGTKTLVGLGPLLDRARAAGIGLVGMKAGRYLAGRKFLGWGKPDAFDDHYEQAFLESGLSPFQRSYAYVLAHGLDVVNADMHSFGHFEENFRAAAESTRFFA